MNLIMVLIHIVEYSPKTTQYLEAIKKLAKMRKKVLTMAKKGDILAKRLRKAALRSGTARKNFLENENFFLTNEIRRASIIKLSPRGGGACTLKIEQCKKNSLCKISTRKGFFKSQK